jgi:hypothetical protein
VVLAFEVLCLGYVQGPFLPSMIVTSVVLAYWAEVEGEQREMRLAIPWWETWLVAGPLLLAPAAFVVSGASIVVVVIQSLLSAIGAAMTWRGLRRIRHAEGRRMLGLLQQVATRLAVDDGPRRTMRTHLTGASAVLAVDYLLAWWGAPDLLAWVGEQRWGYSVLWQVPLASSDADLVSGTLDQLRAAGRLDELVAESERRHPELMPRVRWPGAGRQPGSPTAPPPAP